VYYLIFAIIFDSMKRILFTGIMSLLAVLTSFAQEQNTTPPTDKKQDMPTPPYRKNPELPAFNIQLLDSVTTVSTYNIPNGRPVVIMTFMPDCEHCQKLTEKLLEGMDTLKNILFYMQSPMELVDIRRFANKFHISDYKNIVIGRDKDGFCPQFYMIKFVPFLALYDKHKRLIDSYENSVEVRVLEDASKKNGMIQGVE